MRAGLLLAALVCVASAAADAPINGLPAVSKLTGVVVSTGTATPGNTKEPVIVTSLAAARASNNVDNAKPPEGWPPLSYPNNDEHQWSSQLKTVQKYVNEHKSSLDDLNKQLEEMKEQRLKLLRAQKLLHSMVALHQSEQVLHKLDAHIDKIKLKIKKLGDEADALLSSREDTKKELQDQMKALEEKLTKMREELKRHESTLTALNSKRDEVAGTVGEWRSFVGELKAKAGMTSGDGLTVPKLPRPPSADEEAEEEEEAVEKEDAESKAKAKANEDGEKKAPTEKVEGDKEDPSLFSPEDITAKSHEIKKTSDSIDELLSVHLPRIGIKTSFLEEGRTGRALRHGKHHRKH